MPWTFAHPAAVLPLRRMGLPFGALVAGSVAPDIPSYVPELSIRGWTHSWLGVVTIDLAIGLSVFAVWALWLGPRLVDPVETPSRSRWLLAPVAVVVGAATHVTWDAATHRAEWITDRVPWLRDQQGPLFGYEWAQLVSTVLGGAIVLGYVLIRFRRQRGSEEPARR